MILSTLFFSNKILKGVQDFLDTIYILLQKLMSGRLDPDSKLCSNVIFLFSCKSVELNEYINIIMILLVEKSSNLR